jgi:hypothetical protein
MELTARCPHCQHSVRQQIGTDSAECAACHAPLFIHGTEAFHARGTLDQCPLCGCAHLYRQKDFNRRLGLALLALGIGLAYFTYGISLLVVTGLDWWLFRRVGDVGCCYLCGALFRGFPGVAALAPFNLVFHDHYRALKENSPS